VNLIENNVENIVHLVMALVVIGKNNLQNDFIFNLFNNSIYGSKFADEKYEVFILLNDENNYFIIVFK